jgi:hypothetical protein
MKHSNNRKCKARKGSREAEKQRSRETGEAAEEDAIQAAPLMQK